ncbi:MAG: guanylate kinase [Firmicutes bacterium]|nr:guanylate kinase [Bacillota bacterium]
MIKSKSIGSLIVISGPSGAGKGSVIQGLLKNNSNIWLSVSMTSRSPRPGEVEGVNYYYVSKEEFEKNIKDGYFLEHNYYAGNYYGTPKRFINEKLQAGIDVILEIEINGASNVKKLMDDAIFIFILPPSWKEMKRRLESRNTETKEKIMERFQTAYKEVNEVTKYNYVIVNDDLDESIKKVSSIICAEKCRVDRIEEVYLNSDEEVLHEMLIDNKVFVNEMPGKEKK